MINTFSSFFTCSYILSKRCDQSPGLSSTDRDLNNSGEKGSIILLAIPNSPATSSASKSAPQEPEETNAEGLREIKSDFSLALTSLIFFNGKLTTFSFGSSILLPARAKTMFNDDCF